MKKLVKPYRQYLNKFAEIIKSKIGTSHEKSGRKITNSSQAYCEYNLMLFACSDLSRTV